MRNLLHQFFQLYLANEEFQQKSRRFQEALKTENWVFLKDIIFMIKGEMLSDMFSRDYMKLSAEEKDVVQRTYYNLNQILEFLLHPASWMQKKKMTQIPNLAGKRPKKEER